MGKRNRNEMEEESSTFDRESVYPFSACHLEQQFCRCLAMSGEEYLSPSSVAFPALAKPFPPQSPVQSSKAHMAKAGMDSGYQELPLDRLWGWLKGAVSWLLKPKLSVVLMLAEVPWAGCCSGEPSEPSPAQAARQACLVASHCNSIKNTWSHKSISNSMKVKKM